MIDQIRNFLEQKVFGVCTYLGNKMGIASRYVRLFFIYSVFVANWSPIIIYMILAFWLDIKAYISETKSRIWDL